MSKVMRGGIVSARPLPYTEHERISLHLNRGGRPLLRTELLREPGRRGLMHPIQYDLLVIGSGPAGQKGAIAAAKLNKRVAIIERRTESMGGVRLHTGTIPSKTMREAILHLTGYRQREIYADAYRRKRQVTMSDLRRKLEQVTQHDGHGVQDQTQR